jgi:hypothetical protein
MFKKVFNTGQIIGHNLSLLILGSSLKQDALGRHRDLEPDLLDTVQQDFRLALAVHPISMLSQDGLNLGFILL